MRVCKCVCMCVLVYVCIYICVHVSVCVHVQVCVGMCVLACVCWYVCWCMSIGVCWRTCMCVYMNTRRLCVQLRGQRSPSCSCFLGGKTTTFQNFARLNPHIKFLYCVFNSEFGWSMDYSESSSLGLAVMHWGPVV